MCIPTTFVHSQFTYVLAYISLIVGAMPSGTHLDTLCLSLHRGLKSLWYNCQRSKHEQLIPQISGTEHHCVTHSLSRGRCTRLQGAEMAVEDLVPEEQAELEAIRGRKTQIVAAHRRKKSAANNHSLVPQKVDRERSSTTANMKVKSMQRPPNKVFLRSLHSTCSGPCWPPKC